MNTMGRLLLVEGVIDDFRAMVERDVIKLPDTMSHAEVLAWLADRFHNEMCWRRGENPRNGKAVIPPRV